MLQNNLTKGLFRNDERFGGHADPLLCEGGPNAGRRCETDDDCDGGTCRAGFTAISRNLYKVSFHDVTRFAISKIDLATGQVVGKVDVDEANQGTDLVFSSDGNAAFVGRPVLQQPAHLQHRARTGRRSDDRLRQPVALRPGRHDARRRTATGGSFLTGSELPFILPPQVQLVPIAADPRMLDGRLGAHRQRVRRDDGADAAGRRLGRHHAARRRDPSRRLRASTSRTSCRATSTVVKADSFFCPNGNACQSRLDCNGCAPRVIAVVPSISNPDPLPPQLLDGKILFHTAARDASVPNGIGLGAPAPRFNFDDPDVLEPVGAVVSTSHDASYVACISCHPEGGMDGRSWDFSQFGASIRNTMDLRGRASLAPGVCSDPAGTVLHHRLAVREQRRRNVQQRSVGRLRARHPVRQLRREQPDAGHDVHRRQAVRRRVLERLADHLHHRGRLRRHLPRGRHRRPVPTTTTATSAARSSNTCNFFSCDTQTCSAAKCVAGVRRQRAEERRRRPRKFLNPMMTVHWNGDRDEVEDFEFTYRSLMGAGDCDGVEDLADKCIGALVMRSNVAKPQELSPGSRRTRTAASARGSITWRTTSTA